MRAIMRPTKPLSCFLVVALLGAAIPYRPAQAGLVVTDSVITPARRPESDRERVRALLDRRDLQSQLEEYGISAGEAAGRVDALTDQEIALIADRLNEVPAGGDAGGHDGLVTPASVSHGHRHWAMCARRSMRSGLELTPRRRS